jgi:uncharacterized repeat protein (TIGR01451 family)
LTRRRLRLWRFVIEEYDVMKFVLALFALSLPAAALAQAKPVAVAAPAVTLKSETFVARATTDASGKKKNELFPALRVLPGDPLVFMVSYQNTGKQAATKFVINNPVPNGVDFTGVEQNWATLSVDGGKTYGALASLKVKKADGTMRGALPSDVTHIRWLFATPIAAGGQGRVMFYAVVK